MATGIGNSPTAVSGIPFVRRWRKRLAILLASLILLSGAAYVVRRTLLLSLARIILNHNSDLVAQERADAVAITFQIPPRVWVRPMKNLMNDIWTPIQSNGVNYYTFAGPRTVFDSYSERSNPKSPYYQAWVGGYVVQRKDGSLPDDPRSLASQVTALDQRSWLSAMGDTNPIADPSGASRVGTVLIDGQNLPLWHETMQSHSDLSADPKGPLANLVGMPPKSTWSPAVHSFHDITLDGYFACWIDSRRKVSVVIYAVSASYSGQTEAQTSRDRVNDELLSMMKSAKLESVPQTAK